MFQIQSSGYNKCLKASYIRRRGVYRKVFNGKTHTYRYVVSTSVALSLSDCVYLSKQQSWRWTSDGRLQSDLNQQCLAVTSVWNGYLGKRYGASLQPCNSTTSDQGWVCNGGYLKLKNKNLYLIPFLYSGRRRPSGGITVRSSVTNSCLWARYGTSKSLCGNGMLVHMCNTCFIMFVKIVSEYMYRKIDNWGGGADIHIFMFCIIYFL